MLDENPAFQEIGEATYGRYEEGLLGNPAFQEIGEAIYADENAAKRKRERDKYQKTKGVLETMSRWAKFSPQLEAVVRSTVSAGGQMGASTYGLGARVLGAGDAADEAVREGGRFEQAATELSKKHGAIGGSEYVDRNIRGIERSLMEIVAPAKYGKWAVVGSQMLNQANQSYVKAKDAGRDEEFARKYALIQGSIEGAVTGAFTKFGMGGLESAVTKQAMKEASKQGAREALKTLGKHAAGELSEEMIIAYSQNYVDGVKKLDKKAFTPERLKQIAADTAFQTLGAVGAVSGYQHRAKIGHLSQDAVFALGRLSGNISRKQYADALGVAPSDPSVPATMAERQAVVEEAKTQQPAPAEPQLDTVGLTPELEKLARDAVDSTRPGVGDPVDERVAAAEIGRLPDEQRRAVLDRMKELRDEIDPITGLPRKPTETPSQAKEPAEATTAPLSPDQPQASTLDSSELGKPFGRSGYMFRSFDRPSEATGTERSFSASPGDWADAYTIEFKPSSATPIGHHRESYIGKIDSALVERVYVDPDFWENPSEQLAKDIPELRRLFPHAEFVEVRRSDDDPDTAMVAGSFKPQTTAEPSVGVARLPAAAAASEEARLAGLSDENLREARDAYQQRPGKFQGHLLNLVDAEIGRRGRAEPSQIPVAPQERSLTPERQEIADRVKAAHQPAAPADIPGAIVAAMGPEPIHLDALARQLGVPPNKIMQHTLLLELQKKIKRVGMNEFVSPDSPLAQPKPEKPEKPKKPKPANTSPTRRLSAGVAKAAADNDVDPQDVQARIDALYEVELQSYNDRERIVKSLRNQPIGREVLMVRFHGKRDYVSIRGFDTWAESIANEYPELGIDLNDASEAVWDMLLAKPEPKPTKKQFVDEAVEDSFRAQQDISGGEPSSAAGHDVPFAPVRSSVGAAANFPSRGETGPADYLKAIYDLAADPSEDFARLRSLVDDVFAPLSAKDAKAAAMAFKGGVGIKPKSKPDAIKMVKRWLDDRLESSQRSQAIDEIGKRQSMGAAATPERSGPYDTPHEPWGIGRPELANPGETEQQRDFVDSRDELRKLQGVPAVKPDTETQRQADAISDDDALRRLETATEAELDAVMIAAQRVLRKKIDAFYDSAGDPKAHQDAADAVEKWRNSGTEAGRALRQRRDTQESPAERRYRILGEEILSPPQDSAWKQAQQEIADLKKKLSESERKLADARKDGIDKTKLDQAIETNDRLMNELEEAKKKLARINDKWAKKAKSIMDRLVEAGYDRSHLERIAADPIAWAKLLRELSAAKATKSDKLFEIWNQSILSALTTSGTNVIGTATYAGYSLVGKRFADALVNSVAKNPNEAQWGEFKLLFRGTLARRVQAAKMFFATLSDEGLAGAIGSIVAPEGSRTRRGLDVAKLTWETEIPQFREQFGGKSVSLQEGAGVSVGGKFGRFIRSFGWRPLQTADDFFQTVIALTEVEIRAYRRAKADGLTGDAMAASIESQMLDPKSDAWIEAIDFAAEATFHKELGAIGQGALKVRKGVMGVRWLFPFITTPANLFKLGVKMSPAGSLQPLVNKAATGKYGVTVPMVAQQALAWALAYALFSNDPDDPWITGAAGQGEYAKRNTAYRTHPPQSIKIGGTWYSYERLDPFAVMLATTVDWVNTLRSGQATTGKKAFVPVKSLYTQMKNKTYLQGIGDLIEAGERPDSKVAAWGSNFTSSWMPNIFRQPRRELREHRSEGGIWGEGPDRFSRVMRRTGEKAGILTPTPKVDLWGEEVPVSPVRTDFLWRLLIPSRKKDAETFVADRLLVRWNNANPNEAYNPLAPLKKKPDGSFMTDKEYHDFSVASGRVAKALLDGELLDVDEPTKSDIEVIKRGITDARKMVRDAMKAGKEIDAGAMAEEIRKRHVTSRVETLARRPADIKIPTFGTQAWRNWKAEADAAGTTPVGLRKQKLQALKAEQAAAKQWLKDRGLTEADLRAAYSKPRFTPKTRQEHLNRAVRGFR